MLERAGLVATGFEGGEFGFLLFTQAADAMLVAPAAASLFSAVVTLSMMTTPFLMLFARNLEYSPGSEADLDDPENAPRGSALVIGYGRFGQIVAQMLHAVDCSVTLIDKKPSQIELSGRFDTKVYFGDGLRIDVLRRAGAEEARLIIFCTDDRSIDAAALAPVVEAFPDAREEPRDEGVPAPEVVRRRARRDARLVVDRAMRQAARPLAREHGDARVRQGAPPCGVLRHAPTVSQPLHLL